MKILVGLGNPGKKFENTRHNTGFLVIDELKSQITKSKHQITNKSKILNFKFQKKFNAEILRIINIDSRVRGNDKEEILLVKPMTFMNESGKAVKKVFQYYNKIPVGFQPSGIPIRLTPAGTLQHYNNLYIIHDDLDIPLGEYKIQFGRGSAGHNGVESIIKELGAKDFWRARIGINNRVLDSKSFRVLGEDYVLGKFGKEEKKIINKVIEKIVKKLLSN